MGFWVANRSRQELVHLTNLFHLMRSVDLYHFHDILVNLGNFRFVFLSENRESLPARESRVTLESRESRDFSRESLSAQPCRQISGANFCDSKNSKQIATRTSRDVVRPQPMRQCNREGARTLLGRRRPGRGTGPAFSGPVSCNTADGL